MLRNYKLSPRHYASKWDVKDLADRHDLKKVNDLAYRCALSSDVERPDMQLQLLEYFHGYLIKYYNMIVFSTLPAMDSKQGKDARSFLKIMLPKGAPQDTASFRVACKHLHLAFKECQTSDEVYDTLALVFFTVFSKYDPLYTEKVEKVVKYIETKPADAMFSVDELGAAAGFDCSGIVRLLSTARNSWVSCSAPATEGCAT